MHLYIEGAEIYHLVDRFLGHTSQGCGWVLRTATLSLRPVSLPEPGKVLQAATLGSLPVSVPEPGKVLRATSLGL